MRKVLVITLPAPPAAGESDGFMRSLREMPRASDTELLELDCAGLNWDKKRIFQPAADAQYESSSLPHGAVDAVTPTAANPFYGLEHWQVHWGEPVNIAEG